MTIVRMIVRVPSERAETPWQHAEKIARRKAHNDHYTDHAIFARRRDDDREEHTEKRHAQRVGHDHWQDIAGDDPQRRADGPAWRSNDEGAVAVVWIDIAWSRYRYAKDLISDPEAHQQTVDERRVRRKTLAERTAHEHIAGIGHQCDDEKLEISTQRRHDGERCIFAGGRIDQRAHQPPLKGG